MAKPNWKRIIKWGLYLGACYVSMAAALLWNLRWQHTNSPLDLREIREITVLYPSESRPVPDGLRERLLSSATYERGSPPWKAPLFGEATSRTGETYKIMFQITGHALGVVGQPGFYHINSPVAEELNRFFSPASHMREGGDDCGASDPEETEPAKDH